MRIGGRLVVTYLDVPSETAEPGDWFTLEPIILKILTKRSTNDEIQGNRGSSQVLRYTSA